MEPTVCTSQVNCFDSYSFTFKGSHMMQRHPKTNQQKKKKLNNLQKKTPKLDHSTLEIHKN